METPDGHIPYRRATLRPDPHVLKARVDHALSACDTDAAVAAIREAVLAHGVTHLARDAGLDRVNLYKMLAAGGNPKVGTLVRILDALGLRLELAPARRPEGAGR